jgi:hypothetical protein
VYGIARTIKASKFNVEHHTTHHGQRYKVDRSNERHLVPQIDSCKTKIADYARAKFGDEVANQIAGDRKKPPPFQVSRVGPGRGWRGTRTLTRARAGHLL